MKDEMVMGRSRKFSQVVERADQFAKSPWPVLILGETGVGKELIARRVHRISGRSGAFLPINCGAIPPGLFESELFGHEKGAFSGATQYHRGAVRHAEGGTLFLDEVGELELTLQVKLLRMLDSGEIRAVGSHRMEHVDFRVIAATNSNLYQAVREGTFRHDLLERLSVLTLFIPPIRERKEDITLIARCLFHRYGCTFSEESLNLLCAYEWPGNIRSLRNFVARASVLSKKSITPEILRSLLEEERALSFSPFRQNSESSLAEIEKQVIVDRLKRCQGNRKQAARELGIAKSTLHEKLRRWKNATSEAPWPISRWNSHHTLTP